MLTYDDRLNAWTFPGILTSASRCKYRRHGQTVPGDHLDCKCGDVALYQCEATGDLVTLRPLKSDYARVLSAQRSAYRGRTCDGCTILDQKTSVLLDVQKHLAAMPYHSTSNNIASVTCHFNPQQSKSRMNCFTDFSKQFPRIGMDLYTAEGATTDRWEIPASKYVSRFDIDPDACLFAKENLLNLLIARLPDKIESVLWVDSDVMLLADDYTQRLAEALDRHTFVQGFSELAYIGPHGESVTGWRKSLAKMNCDKGTTTASPNQAYPGLAWAAKRETLNKVGGLYERCVTGGGDVAFTISVYQDKQVPYAKYWSDRLIESILRYSDGFNGVGGSVGFVESRGIHLYHGSLTNRQYTARNAVLSELDFDPDLHLEFAKNGTLRWSREAPEALKRGVREYMHSRREDE